LTLYNVTEADNGTYKVIVSNFIGSTNATAVLTVVPKSAPCTRLSTQHWFGGGTDGASPYGLLWGTNGTLYGTTYFGGDYTQGTVFSLATKGASTTLVSFSGADGANPYAAPVQGADGTLYGTTYLGGASNLGTVFSLATNGALTRLVSFSGTNGGNPRAALVQGVDGNFYGTTFNGGGGGSNGTVFRITSSGALTTLVSFAYTNGANPYAGLVQAADGNFYGTTYSGGANGFGTVFRMTPGGAITTLYSFTTNGATSRPIPVFPAGTLVQHTDHVGQHGIVRGRYDLVVKFQV
jgi:uncharacterized repeat protein (TIGR03803 family)